MSCKDSEQEEEQKRRAQMDAHEPEPEPQPTTNPPTTTLSITPEQRAAVEAELRRTDLTRRVRERLEMVKAAALGDDLARSARWSGRSGETVAHWPARFAPGGRAALPDGPRPRRP